MFVIANFLHAIANVLDIAFTMYTYVLIAQALISWVNPDPRNPIVQTLNSLTEPILSVVRKKMNKMGIYPFISGLDISFLVVFLAIVFLKSALVASLVELAIRIK